MRTTRVLALVLFAAALACVWSSHAVAEPELIHTRLFETDGKVFYRIPALTITNEGIFTNTAHNQPGFNVVWNRKKFMASVSL